MSSKIRGRGKNKIMITGWFPGAYTENSNFEHSKLFTIYLSPKLFSISYPTNVQ